MRVEVEIKGIDRPNLEVRLVREAGEDTVDITNHLPSYRELAAMLEVPLRRYEAPYYYERIPQRGWEHALQLLAARSSTEKLAEAICKYVTKSLERVFKPALAVSHIASSEVIPQISLSTEAPRIAIGGKIYRLVFEGEGDDLITPIREDYKKQVESISVSCSAIIRSYREEAERRITELEKKMAEITPMPIISKKDLERGLHAWVDRDCVLISLPFRYTPKYIREEQGGKEIVKVINPEVAKEMERNVWILFQISRMRIVSMLLYLDPLGENVFDHYHRGCWGNWQHPQHLSIPSSLYLIRDELEKELEIINLSGLAIQNPSGLPSPQFLQKHSEPIKGISWDRERPQQERQEEPRRRQVVWHI